MTPITEIEALGVFYGTPVDRIVAAHSAALARYAEWVLGRDAFALVTLGNVEQLAPLGSATAERRLRTAVARWPDAIVGVKLDAAGRDEPTLYVRPVCEWQDGVEWLEREVGSAVRDIPPVRTLYGLGFQDELIKTYALAPDGFVSWRVDGTGLHREHKQYRAEVAWRDIAWPDARWAAIGALGEQLGFRTAGHVGVTAIGAVENDLKLYVERVGGIPTDRTLA